MRALTTVPSRATYRTYGMNCLSYSTSGGAVSTAAVSNTPDKHILRLYTSRMVGSCERGRGEHVQMRGLSGQSTLVRQKTKIQNTLYEAIDKYTSTIASGKKWIFPIAPSHRILASILLDL
jgi:hypothetical protein